MPAERCTPVSPVANCHRNTGTAAHHGHGNPPPMPTISNDPAQREVVVGPRRLVGPDADVQRLQRRRVHLEPGEVHVLRHAVVDQGQRRHARRAVAVVVQRVELRRKRRGAQLEGDAAGDVGRQRVPHAGQLWEVGSWRLAHLTRRVLCRAVHAASVAKQRDRRREVVICWLGSDGRQQRGGSTPCTRRTQEQVVADSVVWMCLRTLGDTDVALNPLALRPRPIVAGTDT